MKSSFEELLRDLQIISKELFLSSWNLVSTTNLNTAFAFGGASLWNLPSLTMAFAGIWNVGGAGLDGVLRRCSAMPYYRKWLMLHFSKLQRKRDGCLFDDFSKNRFEFQIVEMLFSLQKWMSQEEPRMSLRHRVRQQKTEEKGCIFGILWR